jgi:hypothetical protein
VVRGVVRQDVAREVVALGRQDVLLRAEDRAPERLALERDSLEVVEDDLLHLLFDLLLLEKNDVARVLDGAELRVLEDVYDNADGLQHVHAVSTGFCVRERSAVRVFVGAVGGRAAG